jgi:DNA replication protein DnaC
VTIAPCAPPAIHARSNPLNDPTLADAILDRIVHTAHKIALKGESMRKKQIKP